MISILRESFNKTFTDAKYQLFLKRLDAICGTHVEFPVSETPLFLPGKLIESMASAGKEIIMQLLSNPVYLKSSERAIPRDFNAPNETAHPLFIAVDFGLVRTASGEIAPKLIEMQGFPTLFGFQPVISQQYKEVYGLPQELRYLLGGLELDEYYGLLRRAILGVHAPENVVLLELDPLKQKTRPDFILTDRICGTGTVNIREVVKEGKHLYYTLDGKKTLIRRIYNRAIADELLRSGAQLPFSFRDELDVEWAGHPNWFFRVSKFGLPFLQHPSVPQTYFLSDLSSLPDNLEQWVLKPLYSFAGSGVIVSPSRADIDVLPAHRRADYVLQEKVEYSPVVATPHGGTKAEVRILYLWLDTLMAMSSLVRMGRGKMMGVDYNKNMAWVGSSAGFFLNES
jgi:hypothetical protein